MGIKGSEVEVWKVEEKTVIKLKITAGQNLTIQSKLSKKASALIYYNYVSISKGMEPFWAD